MTTTADLTAALADADDAASTVAVAYKTVIHDAHDAILDLYYAADTDSPAGNMLAVLLRHAQDAVSAAAGLTDVTALAVGATAAADRARQAIEVADMGSIDTAAVTA